MIAGPVTCPVFVGREAELAALNSARRALSQSRGSVVLVSGEAGIGKSRLLAQFLGPVGRDPRPRNVAGAECIERAAQPFGPFRDLIAALGGESLADEYPPSVARAIAQLSHVPGSAGAGQLDKSQLFAGVAGFLKIVAAKRTTILTIEDIHWADRSSLELLAYLAPRIAGTRLLLVATYRSDEVETREALFAAVSRLSREPTVARIALEPLGGRETQALIDGALSGRPSLPLETKVDVAARSEGNPFFVEELLKDALESGRNSGSSKLPISIRGTIADRLAFLSADEQRIIAHAAVLGFRFEPEVLALTIDRDVGSIMPTLRRGRDLNIFVEENDERVRFRFRHALIRQAVYDDMLVFDARATHERILRTLESLGEKDRHVEALAYHALAAKDAEKTLLYNELAGKAALELRALPEARAFFERALAVAPNRLREAELIFAVCGVTQMEGLLEEAVKRAESALAIFIEIGEFDRAAETVRSMAANRNNLGDPGGVKFGINFLAEYGSRLNQTAHDWLRSTLARLATVLFDTEVAEEMLAGVRAPDALPPQARQSYLIAKMDLAWFSGDVDAWRVLALQLLDTVPHVVPFSAVIALYAVAQSASSLGLCDLADRSFARAQPIESQWDFGGLREHGVALRASHDYTYGRLERARAEIRRALDGSQARVAQSALELVAPLVSVALGDDSLISETNERNMAFGRPDVFGADDAHLLASDAAMKVARGQLEAARADLRTAVSILDKAYPSSGVLLTLAARHLLENDLAPLRALIPLERYLPNDRAGRANATLTQAILEQRFGDAARAVALARAAAADYRELGWPLFEAQALEVAGEQATARAIYVNCGAIAEVRRLTPREIAAVGRDAAKLSERELSIARLVAQGWTNAAIGESLAINVKTVEKHISSIFSKLDVRKRSQIAAVFAQQR